MDDDACANKDTKDKDREIADLRRALNVARRALEWYAEATISDPRNRSVKALGKIKEILGR